MMRKILTLVVGCCAASFLPIRSSSVPGRYIRGALPQDPLTTTTASYERGAYTKLQQDGSVCQTLGEKQWTGTVDVTDERRLFYYFIDSRDRPEKDPIILWLNG
jgi:carboxypeptidase C (cathepsin A)